MFALPIRKSHLAAPVIAALLMCPTLAGANDAGPVRQVLPGGQAPEASQQLTRQVPPDESEIQRFCSNIADAARDRRYALQAEELKQLQAGIDQRMKALEAKRAEYETWLKRREVFLARAEESLVKIYAGMKPDAAAERLAMVNVDLAAAARLVAAHLRRLIRGPEEKGAPVRWAGALFRGFTRGSSVHAHGQRH